LSDPYIISIPTIEKVDETIVMSSSGGESIYYTFDSDEQPANPDNTSTLYVEPITYVEGYYKAIAYDNGTYSGIGSRSFGREVVTDYIALYKLEDNLATTNVLDETTNFNGTSARNTDLMSSAGVKGLSFSFDGTNDYFSAMIGAYASKSYSFLFQIENTTGLKGLIFYGTSSGGSSATSDAIYISGNKLVLYTFDGGQKSQIGTTELSSNTWYHCIVNWVNSGACKVYLNNVEEISVTVGTRWAGGDRHWIAKNSGDIGTSLLNGKMDEIRFYNRNLTEQERTDVYNDEKP
jgi:hypothetical protein